jgi:hypothetical protein
MFTQPPSLSSTPRLGRADFPCAPWAVPPTPSPGERRPIPRFAHQPGMGTNSATRYGSYQATTRPAEESPPRVVVVAPPHVEVPPRSDAICQGMRRLTDHHLVGGAEPTPVRPPASRGGQSLNPAGLSTILPALRSLPPRSSKPRPDVFNVHRAGVWLHSFRAASRLAFSNRAISLYLLRHSSFRHGAEQNI